MSALVPRAYASLLAQALAELAAERSVFGLPRRSFWQPRAGLDLSAPLVAGRAATPLGPAAGPHTQLAPNIVCAWLAGSRVIELKTVQVLDRLEIPRPCIDAPSAGWNVEWSQELTLEESAAQYAAAWGLVHVLAARGVAPDSGTRFDVSVGYDLAGIRSAQVARFLDTLSSAGALLREQRDSLPAGLRAAGDVPMPARIADTATLSTFHGCPPGEIEAIALHLMERHRMNVVLKLNPTLLGEGELDELLRGRLGWEEIALDHEAFARDPDWNAALAMIGRLRTAATARGLALGVKLTNTLVVRNTRGRLAGDVAYLSGPPLHAVALALAARLARATGGAVPLSFSAGVDAENFAETVACGFAPVTTCTDLLRPTGYRRLPRYLKALEAAMEAAGVHDLAGWVLSRAGTKEEATECNVRAAALANLERYAAEAADDPRYRAERHRAEPERHGALALFDCESCNACVTCCPNGAFFSAEAAPVSLAAPDLVWDGGAAQALDAVFATTRESQWMLSADACNACGNCDTFCPESGGPFRVKPRFFGSAESFQAAAPEDGLLLEAGGRRMRARFGGAEYRAEFLEGGGARFGDGVAEATLDAAHRVVSTRAVHPREGHVLPLARYHAMRVLRDAALSGINPVSTAWLPALVSAPA